MKKIITLLVLTITLASCKSNKEYAALEAKYTQTKDQLLAVQTNLQKCLIEKEKQETKAFALGEQVKYLKEDKILFPNAIILALDPIVEFKQSRGPVPEGVINTSDPGVLELPILPDGNRVAWIVDGQQRSTALSKSYNPTLNVHVIGFHCPDIETQRAQFILVNKARPLPRNLIDELLPEINSPMPSDLSKRKIPSELVNVLARTKDSPFFGIVKRPSDPVGSNGVITDTALIKVAENSLNNYGALSLYKGLTPE